MLSVEGLIWDEWNKDHIAKHNVTPEEVEKFVTENIRLFLVSEAEYNSQEKLNLEKN